MAEQLSAEEARFDQHGTNAKWLNFRRQRLHPTFNIRLEDKDKEKPLGKKERDALMFRLGVLTVERVNAQRAYEDARYRARDL